MRVEAGGPVRGRVTAIVQMTNDSASSGVGEERMDLGNILNGELTGSVER